MNYLFQSTYKKCQNLLNKIYLDLLHMTPNNHNLYYYPELDTLTNEYQQYSYILNNIESSIRYTRDGNIRFPEQQFGLNEQTIRRYNDRFEELYINIKALYDAVKHVKNNPELATITNAEIVNHPIAHAEYNNEDDNNDDIERGGGLKYNIQAVLFSNELYNTKKARLFLKKHNIIPIKKVHKTEKYLRYRILKPKNKSNYITKSISDGIYLILMK